MYQIQSEMRETIDYRPDVAKMLNQTLRNQKTMLYAMSRFINHNRYDEDDYRWRYINQHLVGEYHRTREILGEEEAGKYWRPETEKYLIQFGIYRMYDNAKKTLLVARQNGINAVMRYNGTFFRVVSKSTYEDHSIASFICASTIMKHERLAYSFVRKTDSF